MAKERLQIIISHERGKKNNRTDFLTLLQQELVAVIAKYLKDQFIRGFIGDVLVVILIYCFLRTFINADHKKIAFGVFLFACSVEILQAFTFVKVLGLEQNKIASIVLGSTFDWKDIMAYFIGFLICMKVK